ncbi:MAG: TlpA family protein disulfide reductase [bacterium]|nr:TlpA family protein disulfide reductase [bacterium]
MRSRPILTLLSLILISLIPLACGEQAAVDTFCSPAEPSPGEAVVFSFDLSGEGYRLGDASAIEMLYTLVDGNGEMVTSTLPLHMANGLWEGTLTPAAAMPSGPVLMVCALLNSQDQEIYDNRQGKPWAVSFHENGKPVEGADHQQFRMLTGRLRLCDLLTGPKDPERGGELIARELVNHPDNFMAKISQWGRAINETAEGSAEREQLSEETFVKLRDWLVGWNDRGEPGDEMTAALSFMSRLNHSGYGDSLGAVVVEAYPQSGFASTWAYASAMSGATPADKVNGLLEYVNDFPEADDAPYARGLILYYGQVMAVNPIAAREVIDGGKAVTSYLMQYYAGALVQAGDLELGEAVMRRMLDDVRAETWDNTTGDPEHIWLMDHTYSIIGGMQALADVVKQRGRDSEALGILGQIIIDFPDNVGLDTVREQLAIQLQLGRTSEALKAFELLATKAKLTDEEVAQWLELSGQDESSFMANLEGTYAKAQAALFADYEKHALRFDAPEATFTDITGESFTLSSLKGKVVLIDFWATWCGPCMRALPHINEIGKDYGHDGELFIIPANTWERSIGEARKEAAAAKWTELGMNIPYYLDADRGEDVPHAVDDFGVTGIPSTFLLGPSGKLLFRKTGMGGEADVADLRSKIDYAISLIQ